jgi:hypothetical protein
MYTKMEFGFFHGVMYKKKRPSPSVFSRSGSGVDGCFLACKAIDDVGVCNTVPRFVLVLIATCEGNWKEFADGATAMHKRKTAAESHPGILEGWLERAIIG